MSIFAYDTDPDNNGTIGTGTSIAEGNTPTGNMNDAVRILMSDIAEFFADHHKPIGTTGASNVYAVQTTKAFASYVKGMNFLVRPNHTNTGAATVNVGGTGAKSLKVNGADPAAGAIATDSLQLWCYDDANDWFNVIGAKVVDAALGANLAALAGLAGGADKLPYFTGSGAMDLTDITSLARGLLNDSSKAQMRTTLDIGALSLVPIAGGRMSGAGTGSAETGATGARTGTGVYRITFDSAEADTNYIPLAISGATADRTISVPAASITTTHFDVNAYSNGTPTDVSFQYIVLRAI